MKDCLVMVHILYFNLNRIQPKPNGLPIFILGEEFIGNDNVCMILGDNIIFGNELDTILKKSPKQEQVEQS